MSADRITEAGADHEAHCERVRNIVREFDGYSGSMAVEIDRLRQSATACEKLLRDVGTGGRFNLAAENSDEADAWYAERDAILAKGETK